ncbi:MAG: FAD-dependent oxidoreductase [Oscillospiraceae bacterium]|nr:FAD-dependent oxidoreductase [Oscillospiraceae bacterium]
MAKIRLNINGRELEGFSGQTILDVATENGILIPTLCHDKRLDTYGACGICVVAMEGTTRLYRACATEIAEGMVIYTDTPMVHESRKVNLELLLSQHRGDCRAPCSEACPAKTDCQGYVGLIANGEMEEALKLIKERVPLAASIGRVCPHPCEEACRRQLVEEPISILNLKRFAADIDLDNPEPYLPDIAPATDRSVGIIGGGPGGLSCAYFLASMGHEVTIYDAMPKMGGMLRYGIPEYRLPKAVLDKEVGLIEKMGVAFENNVKIGTDRSFDSLRDSHDAVVIAIGAWKSTELTVPGADLPGNYGGIDFLRMVYSNEPVSIGKNVAVIGGGNTAMDAVRTAVRLGAENVYIVYRRTKAEMPAEEIEIIEAEEEGVQFKFLVNPLEVIGENGKVAKLRLQKMELGEPDASGRRSPVAIEGEEELLEVDTVIAALGQGILPDGFPGINLTQYNTVVADEEVFTTNLEGVFAIGDCINNGAGIAIASIGHAKKAANAIDDYLFGGDVTFTEPYRVKQDDLTAADFADYKKEPRSKAEHLHPEDRKDNFLEVLDTFDLEAAVKDAKRCLECGCHDYFECMLIALSDLYGVDPTRFRESVPNFDYFDDHPFIVRDPNKCILCGLCVRICDEFVGSTALGFVDRGFHTTVAPAFGDSLRNTTCISCGQCVSVCPTGALQERITLKKSIPLDTKKTSSICGLCSVGCSTKVESVGNMLVKTSPATDCGVNNGVMCGKGRFGLNYVQQEGRITEPMIRIGGELKAVSWNEAFVYTAKKMESYKIRGEKTAVSIGQTYCVEDAGAILNLAEIFGADVFSFANRDNGLASVLGYDASPNTLEEILGANALFVFGTSLLSNPVILTRLRTAAKNGVPVYVISDGPVQFNINCTVVKPSNSTGFIKEVTKALIDLGAAPNNANGFDELKAALEGVSVSDDAQLIATAYKNAAKAMVLYAIGDLTPAAATEIANMAVVCGHIGKQRAGIYMLRQMSGSQALANFGVTATAEVAKGAKALMVFGEDTNDISDDVDFLVVQDTHFTETANKADVVFPLAAYPEIDGTFVNTDGIAQIGAKVVDAPTEYRTADIVQGLADILEEYAPAGCLCDMDLCCNDSDCDCDCDCSEVSAGAITEFGYDDEKAKLQVIADGELFDQLKLTSYLLSTIEAQLPKPVSV